MKKCVIYSRVSSSTQNYESQTKDLLNYAKSHNIKVAKTFAEKVSGFDQTKDRNEYDHMKEFVIENNIKLILMWEISRLSRTTLKSLKEIQYFTSKKINIYFKKENINTLSDDASNKLLLSIMSTMAEMERDNIIRRVSRGHRESVAKGKRTGLMTLPYGFKAVDSYLVIDKEEAEVIKLIYQLADEGTPQRSIALHLNSLNIPTRWTKLKRVNINSYGKTIPIKWKPNSVGVILHNQIYKGKRKYKDEIFDVDIIIDPIIWDRVQTKLIKKPGYLLKPTKYNYLFKGKIKCGSCGRSYGVQTELRYDKSTAYYDCNGRKDLTLRCKNGRVKGSVLDDRIYNVIFDHKDLLIKLKEESLKNFNIDEKEGQILFFKSEINDLNGRVKRLIDLYKDGYIAKNDFNSEQKSNSGKIKEFTFKKEKIQKEIKYFNDSKNDDNWKNDFVKYWANEEFDAKREFVEKYVNELIVSKIKTFDLSNEDINKIYSKDEAVSKFLLQETLKKPNKWGAKYIEVFVFDNPTPIKCVLFIRDNLMFHSDLFILKDYVLKIKKALRREPLKK